MGIRVVDDGFEVKLPLILEVSTCLQKGRSVSTSSDLTPWRIHEEARTKTWSVSKSDRPFHPPNKYSLRKEQTSKTIVYGARDSKEGRAPVFGREGDRV
jgi:hypothetical protein